MTLEKAESIRDRFIQEIEDAKSSSDSSRIQNALNNWLLSEILVELIETRMRNNGL